MFSSVCDGQLADAGWGKDVRKRNVNLQLGWSGDHSMNIMHHLYRPCVHLAWIGEGSLGVRRDEDVSKVAQSNLRAPRRLTETVDGVCRIEREKTYSDFGYVLGLFIHTCIQRRDSAVWKFWATE